MSAAGGRSQISEKNRICPVIARFPGLIRTEAVRILPKKMPKVSEKGGRVVYNKARNGE